MSVTEMQQITGIIAGDRSTSKIVIARQYLELCNGDYVEAVVLKEIAYWSATYAADPNRNGWWWRNAEQWESEVFLEYRKVKRAIARLNNDVPGLIEQQVRKVGTETCMFFRLSPEVFTEWVNSAFPDLLPKAPTRPPVIVGKCRNGNSQNEVGNYRNGNSLGTTETAIPLLTPVSTPVHIPASGDAEVPDPPKPKRKPKPTFAKDQVYADPLFHKFWEAWPTKVAKLDAARVWHKIKPDAALVEQMIASIGRWIRTDKWQAEGGQFIPAPDRWLRGEKWNDDPTPHLPAAASSVDLLDQNNWQDYQRSQGYVETERPEWDPMKEAAQARRVTPHA